MTAPSPAQSLLAEFLAAATPLEGVEGSHHHDGGEHSRHLVFGAVTHGNETGSLPAFRRLQRQLRSGEVSFGGRVTLLCGNLEAVRVGRRFCESDLNRAFSETPPETLEGRRSLQMRRVLDTADLFVDFHQTMKPTQRAFYIGPWDAQMELWARVMGGADVWITRAPGAGFTSDGTVCADEYVRGRGGLGLTLELGVAGLNADAETRCYTAMLRALDVARNGAGLDAQLALAAASAPAMEFVLTAHKEAFVDPRMALRPGLTNFQSVSANEPLQAQGSPTVVSPVDGYLLFPKYPERLDGAALAPRPSDLFNVGVPMTEHPGGLWGD